MIDIGSPQFLFMCEAEGLDDQVDTRTAKINAVIKEVRNYPSTTIDSGTFGAILAKHRLTDLTQAELLKIQNGIR